ncbi:MAG: hypothetical protein JO057_26365 [Chloroflexi bacterium]|nr:hypothetical protein [Chloroflexota bacterium]
MNRGERHALYSYVPDYANRVGVWRIMRVLDRDGIPEVVTACLERGWELMGLDVLRDAGLQYICDWVNDDLPYRFDNGLWSLPYTTELNDMRLIRPPLSAGSEWGELAKRAFRTLYDEGDEMPRVFCLALHPFVTGLPGRIAVLEDILSYVVSHDHVWKATGQEIIDHYRTHA